MYKREASIPPSEKTSIIFWLTMAFLFIFFFISPFYKGLFNGRSPDFEGPIYTNWFWGASCLFLLSIHLFTSWRLDKRGILSLLVLLLPISYLISFTNAASVHLNKHMLLTMLLYASFFLLALYYAKSLFGALTILNGILVSGYIVVWFGISTIFGNLYYMHSIMITEYGFRLTAVFQYANAYAAYLIALFFSTLFIISSSKKKYIQIICSFMLVPITLSIMLTYSRGGFVLIPFIVLAIIPFLDIRRQIRFFVYSLLSLLCCIAVLQPIVDIGIPISKIIETQINSSVPAPTISVLEHKSWLGWSYVLGTSLLFTIFVYIIEALFKKYGDKTFNKLVEKRFTNLIIPAFIILMSVCTVILLNSSTLIGVLPTSLKERLVSINFQENSVLERVTFFKDALKLVSDYPFLGAGGGAWATLYEQYQNNPYTSREAHNFFLQYLTEAGIIGLTVFLLFVGYILYSFLKAYRKDKNNEMLLIFYIFAISILFHSMLDFEMSFLYLACIVFICLGGMASFASSTEVRSDIRLGDPPRKVQYLYPILLCLISIYFIFTSISYIKAHSLFRVSSQYIAEKKPLEEISKPLNEAIKLTANPSYTATKLSIMNQVYIQTKDPKYLAEAQILINMLEQNEPYNRQLFNEKIKLYRNNKEYDKAIETALKGIDNYRWDLTVYEQAISLLTEYGAQSAEKKNQSYWIKAFDILKIVEHKTEELKNLPKGQLQGRDFFVSPSIVLNIGQIYYMQGKYQESSEFLKRRIYSEFFEPADPIIARWYLASLRKQGKDDPGLLERLIQKDPNEKQQLDILLNSNFN
ncbi:MULTISPECIES: O-antigen ligase family protein [Paenibacillus]|uniref:O-antigen ligase family protein n=1 Tax=Paenibacillus TaxID=44249 RepID=UPI0022B8B728|nr:O-antigen ligase family protein [Paenibacillus caseinilyticus]MCZ8523106.1 O-antigen ligase family protein [Paenibacillus caseinilyticus]